MYASDDPTSAYFGTLTIGRVGLLYPPRKVGAHWIAFGNLVREGSDRGGPNRYRMDRDNLEPDDRLRPDLTGVRQLLRAHVGEAAQGDGQPEVPERR